MLRELIMMGRKIIFITVLCFFSFVMNVSARTKFSIDTKTVSLGDTISVDLYIKDNPGFGILSMKVKYDFDYLEYVSYEMGKLEDVTLSGVELDKNKNIVFYALSVQKLLQTNNDVPILKLNFKDRGKTGTANIILEVQNYAYDETLNLDYEIENGKIIIQNVEPIQKEENSSLKNELPKEIPTEDVKWVSSDNSIASVDEEGNVTFHKDGNVTISAIQDSEKIYEKNYEVSLSKENSLEREDEEKEKQFKIEVFFPIFFLFLIFLSILLKILLKRKKCRRKNK